MNQALAQWRFRKQNRQFQRGLIQQMASKRSAKEIEEGKRACSFKLFLKPKHRDVLKSLGLSFLAPRVESELKTQAIGRGESYFETHGYVVSLKGFWREFRLFFAELDKQGTLFNSEVYVLDQSTMSWHAIWWAHLTPTINQSEELTHGSSLSQDDQQEATQANQSGTGSDCLLQRYASEVGQSAEIRPDSGFVETTQDVNDI